MYLTSVCDENRHAPRVTESLPDARLPGSKKRHLRAELVWHSPLVDLARGHCLVGAVLEATEEHARER
jgi:hypothetical protein